MAEAIHEDERWQQEDQFVDLLKSTRSSRRSFLGAGAITLGAAAAALNLGQFIHRSFNPESQQVTLPNTYPSIDPPTYPEFDWLTEEDLKGEKYSLTEAFHIQATLMTRNPDQPQEGIDELAKHVGLYKVATAGGRFYQLDLGLPILEKIPLTRLELTLREKGSNPDIILYSFPLEEVVEMLNEQNIHRSDGFKLSLFFHEFDPAKGVMRREGKIYYFSNLKAIREPPVLSDENFTLRAEVMNDPRPELQQISAGINGFPTQLWGILRSRETEMLQINIIPKGDGPRIAPTVEPSPFIRPRNIRSS